MIETKTDFSPKISPKHSPNNSILKNYNYDEKRDSKYFSKNKLNLPDID